MRRSALHLAHQSFSHLSLFSIVFFFSREIKQARGDKNKMVLWEGDRASLWAVYDERDPVGLEEGCEECHQKLRKRQ